MPLSIEQLGEVDNVIGHWCLARVQPEIKSQLDYDYEVDGQAVTVFEVRPLWRGKPGEILRNPFARMRYVKVRASWQIYWMRASGKWQSYEPDPTARDLKAALAIITRDEYRCFFG